MIDDLAYHQGLTATVSAIPTMNLFNLDDLLENLLLITATATLCLVVVGNLQALVVNHDIGATVAEAMEAVGEDQMMNGVVAAEEDRCEVDPETDPETDRDGLVMIDEIPVVTNETRAGSGGVTFRKCRKATETSDRDVRSVLPMVRL